MTTIRQLLDQKGRDTWSTHPDATVLEAAAKMAEKNIGSLIVMDGGTFLGIITERHVARNTATMTPNSPVALVRDVMETRVLGYYPPPPRITFSFSNQQLTPILSRSLVESNCRRDASRATGRKGVWVIFSRTLLS